MALVPWNAFNDLERFFDEDQFPFAAASGKPAMDLYEENNNVVAELNLPGIDPQNIDVSVENGILRVAGTEEERTEDEQKDYWRKEIRKGSFERAIRLPAPVDENNVEAVHEDGVLTITMPKTDGREERKKIEVKTKS